MNTVTTVILEWTRSACVPALALAVVLLSSCSSGWVEPAGQVASIDQHLLLHSLNDLDEHGDRMMAQARSSRNAELQRAAAIIEFERAQRRAALERWLRHDDREAPVLVSCAITTAPFLTRGIRGDASLLEALIEQRECALELLRRSTPPEDETTLELMTALGASYRQDLRALRAVAATTGQ